MNHYFLDISNFQPVGIFITVQIPIQHVIMVLVELEKSNRINHYCLMPWLIDVEPWGVCLAP